MREKCGAAVAASPAGDAAVATKRTYYINPEYKQPEDVTDASTEQDAPGVRLWKWSGDETSYPFWAVERVSADWLRQKHVEAKHAKLEFNVERKTLEFACVTVGAVGGSSIAITVAVSLPVLTNPRKLQTDDRLLLEVAPQPAVKKRKAETWKTDVANAAKALIKEEQHAKSKPKLASRGALQIQI